MQENYCSQLKGKIYALTHSILDLITLKSLVVKTSPLDNIAESKVNTYKKKITFFLHCCRYIPSTRIIPSILVAFSTLLVFYLLYFVKCTTPAILLFFLSMLFSIPLCIFLIMCRIKRRRIIKKYLHYKKVASFLLCFFLGVNIATIAYIRFLCCILPPFSLASMQKTRKITVSLLEDAYPAGKSYYKIKAKILKCKYDNGSSYSCNGETLLCVPSVFIKQNYSGFHATLKSKASEITLFSKGLLLEVDGHFTKRNKKENYSIQCFIVSPNSDFKFEGWASFIYPYRTRMRFFMNKLLYGWKNAGSLLQALLTANRDFLNIDDVKAFRQAGLSHVLALSGMHLAIIGGIAHFFSAFFLGRKLMKMVILTISFLFLIFAGASPSLIRSFLMLCILAITRLLYVKTELLPVLAFTCLLHLLAFPQDALTLSFILSYSALFGILLFSEAIYNLLNPFIPDLLCASISASLAATCATIPIIAISFGQVSIIGVISTCIISPLISAFLVLGISFIVMSMLLPIIYYLCGTMLNIFYDTIIATVHIFSLCPVIRCETTVSHILSFLPFILGIFLVIFERHLQEIRKQKLII